VTRFGDDFDGDDFDYDDDRFMDEQERHDEVMDEMEEQTELQRGALSEDGFADALQMGAGHFHDDDGGGWDDDGDDDSGGGGGHDFDEAMSVFKEHVGPDLDGDDGGDLDREWAEFELPDADLADELADAHLEQIDTDHDNDPDTDPLGGLI
jgi:hypothetical protein